MVTDGDVAELTVLAKHNRALVTRPRLWGAVRVVDLAGAQRRIASLLKMLRKAYPLRPGIPEAVDTAIKVSWTDSCGAILEALVRRTW